MPIYTIEGPDKRTYDIEGPEGASEKDLFSTVQQHIRQEERAARQEAKDAELAKLKERAAESRRLAEAPTPEGGFWAAAKAGKEQLIADTARLAGRAGAMDIGEAEAAAQAREKKAEETFKGTEDGWLESPWQKFKETAGGSLPYMAAPVAAGLAAAALPLTGTAATIAGLGATGLASLAQFTGSNLTTQVKGETESGVAGKDLADTDLGNAFLGAIPQAALDVLSLKMMPGIQKIFKSAGKEFTQAELQALAQRTIKEKVAERAFQVAKTAGVEGGTEAGQEFFNRLQAGLPTDNQKAYDAYIENFIGGAVLGGVGRTIIPESKTLKKEEKPVTETETGTATGAETTQAAPPALTPEQIRIQKQRAALEKFGETAEFPPEIAPTGQVSREERQRAAQAQADAQATGLAPSNEPVQGDLFLDAAQRARAEGAPVSEQQRLFDAATVSQPTAQGTVAPAPVEGNAAPEAVPAGQGTLPLVGGRTAAQMKIENYIAQQNADAVGYAKLQQEERAAQGAEGARLEKMAVQKFKSDLAETDARLQSTREKTAEDNRLSLLLPLLENTAIGNIPKAFDRALQGAGITNKEFTPRERELIQRAYDVRVAMGLRPAEKVELETEVVPSTPNEMDVYQEAQQQEPQQLGLAGFGKPKGAVQTAPVAEEEAAPETKVVGQDAVDYLFLPKASAVSQNILGKDLTDPAQRAYVADQLKAARDAFAARTDPRSRTAVKRINDILASSPFVRTQGEMFGPRGGVLTQPKAPTQGGTNVQPSAQTNQRPAAQPAAQPGTSQPTVGVGSASSTAGTGGTGSAAGVSSTKRGRLDATSGRAKSDTAGTEKKPAPVKKEAPKAEPAKKAGLPSSGITANDTPEVARVKNTIARQKERVTERAAAGKDTTATKSTLAVYEQELNRLTKGAEQDNDLTAAEQEAKVAQLKAKNDAAVRSGMAEALMAWGKLPADQTPATEAGKDKKLKLEEAMGASVSDDVQSALKAGDVAGALNTLAAETKGVMGAIARILAKALTGTKIKVVNNLKDDAGKATPGMFDPATNTIYLDSSTGMTAHALIHEAVHGALSHILDNPNHPVTKQLDAIFKKVQPFLSSAYGATNLQEFVAEAWGNQQFRTQLAAINPDGTAVSALQKFTNVIKNFVRRLMGAQPKAIGSVMDQVDVLMESAISPAPDARVGEVLYMASANGGGAAVLNGYINKIVDNLPGLSEARKNKLHDAATRGVSNIFRDSVLRTMPLDVFAKAAAVNNTLPQAEQLNDLVRRHGGRLSERIKTIEARNDNAIKWWNKQTEATKTEFNAIVNEASRESLDMFDPKGRDAYKGDPEQQKAYDALKPRFDKLFANAEARTVYQDVLNTYKDLREDAVKNIGSLVSNSIEDKARATSAAGIIQKLLNQMGTIKGYVPFERRGDFRLSYQMEGSPEPIIRHFESERAREMAVQEAIAAGAKKDTIERFSKITDYNYKNAPSGSFMNQIVKTMEVNKVPSDVMDKVIAQWIDMMPETSFAQGFRKRKGTIGFNEQVLDVFSRKPFAFARQITNMETVAETRDLMAKAREHVNETGATEAGRNFLREFDRRASFVMNPDTADWSKTLTTATFGMTIGANISSAISNATGIPIVIGPYLAGAYGPAASMKAIGAATKAFMGSGSTHLVDGKTVKGGKSLENYNFADPNLPANIRRYETLVKRGVELGQFGRSLTQDILDIEDGSSSIRSKVNKYMGYFMHHGERLNRQVTLAAAFDLELDRLNNNPKPNERSLSQEEKETRAADKAINTTEMLNGGISAMSAPSIAQGSIGRVAFMYKRYGVSMYYMMFNTAKDALRNADPEVRKQAWKQLGWVSGSATLMAGVRGAPLYGAVRMLYDMFRDDDDDNFDTVMRKWVGDVAFGGMFNAATGLEIGSRVGMTDMIFKPSQSTDDNQTALDIAVEFIGGPAYGTAKRLMRGSKMINEGNFERGLEQMLPSSIANPIKSIRYGTEGANTLRGDPITSEISPWNVAAQAFGFAPAEYTKQLEINANEKSISRYETTHRTNMLKEFYLASRQGDSEHAARIMEQIQKWNAKHPYPGEAITADAVRASMQKHMKEAMMMRSGINISKARMPEFLKNMREYEGQ